MDVASTYIFFRDAESDSELEGLAVGALADWVFWNAWRTRQNPYSVGALRIEHSCSYFGEGRSVYTVAAA